MTVKTAASKPAKPNAGFPLTAHNCGQWVKKIKGKRYYFGPWDDADGALKNYLAQAEDLHAGQPAAPVSVESSLTVRDLCNQYLAVKEGQVSSGELATVSYMAIRTTAQKMADFFGTRTLASDVKPEGFNAYKTKHAQPHGTLGMVAMDNEIQRVRSIFKFAYDMDWLNKPVKFGPVFKKRKAKQKQRHRADQVSKFFAAQEINALLAASKQPRVTAQIWLGINLGFGNRDCGTLRLSSLDLDNATLSHARPKTGVERENVPLWPETVAAIRVAIDQRTEPRKEEFSNLVFLTERGNPWARETYSGPLMQEFGKLRTAIGMASAGKGFYSLRHTFETIGCQTGIQFAVNYIMGHKDSSMAGNYRAFVAHKNLLTVTNYVREWLLAG